ncbi:hypothetical protein AB6A40_008145 [Gnathostoma spinigerum]|uniref:Uncharacterized protein n=1 Tax=Gnathostoma spinigerum TaxID=75299 RepID=A0ABD6EQ73_9BILA
MHSALICYHQNPTILSVSLSFVHHCCALYQLFLYGTILCLLLYCGLPILFLFLASSMDKAFPVNSTVVDRQAQSANFYQISLIDFFNLLYRISFAIAYFSLASMCQMLFKCRMSFHILNVVVMFLEASIPFLFFAFVRMFVINSDVSLSVECRNTFDICKDFQKIFSLYKY